MLWSWCGGHPDWTNEKWEEFLIDLKALGIGGVLLGGGAEQVRRISKLAGRLGFAVHAWMWTFCRPSDEVAERNLGWYQRNRKGESSLEKPPYVGYYKWLCPSNEECVEYILREAAELCSIQDIEALHLDYVRFPDVILAKTLQPKYNIVQDREYPEWDYCYCRNCVEGFREQNGIDILEAEDPSQVIEWKQYRYALVVKVVDRVSQTAHHRDKLLSAAVFPHPDLARFICRQSWDDYSVDIFFPMIYHSFYDESLTWIGDATTKGVQALSKRGKGQKLMTGLYLPALQSTRELQEAITVASKSGASGVSLFDAENIKPYHVEALRQLELTILFTDKNK